MTPLFKFDPAIHIDIKLPIWIKMPIDSRWQGANFSKCCTVNERPLYSRMCVSIVQHDIKPLVRRRSNEVPGNLHELLLRRGKRMIALDVTCV